MLQVHDAMSINFDLGGLYNMMRWRWWWWFHTEKERERRRRRVMRTDFAFASQVSVAKMLTSVFFLFKTKLGHFLILRLFFCSIWIRVRVSQYPGYKENSGKLEDFNGVEYRWKVKFHDDKAEKSKIFLKLTFPILRNFAQNFL